MAKRLSLKVRVWAGLSFSEEDIFHSLLLCHLIPSIIFISMFASVGTFWQLSKLSWFIDYDHRPPSFLLQHLLLHFRDLIFPSSFTSTWKGSVKKLQSNLIIDIGTNFYLNIVYKYFHGYQIFDHVLLFFSKSKDFNFCYNLKL